ncbi:hypothetical protein ACQ86G_14290 [Roseateles chitinivorans]|uniref:hypothetical protein n=1 Tax=Roseateles chitinivorans TaxID=2917965 RepID=UPI003D67066E
MIRSMARVARAMSRGLTVSALALALAACGGGGSDAAPELSIGELSPGSIAVAMGDGAQAKLPEFTLSASFSGTPGSDTVYVIVDDPDRLVVGAAPALTGNRASLTLSVGNSAGPGRYTQPVVIKVCKDAACTQQYAGSPQTVRKDVQIDTLAVSATTLNFSAPVGAGGPAQDLAVTLPAGKTYSLFMSLVEHRDPRGGTFRATNEVFSFKNTPTGMQIKPLGGWAGTYTATLGLSSPGFKDKVVTLSYEVAGASVQALTLLTPTLEVSSAGGDSLLASVDVLMPIQSVLNITRIGSPAPDWLQGYDVVPFTSGDGPANNARHVRFRFNRCGLVGFPSCLASGTYNATIRIDAVAYGHTWTYSVPVIYTVP